MKTARFALFSPYGLRAALCAVLVPFVPKGAAGHFEATLRRCERKIAYSRF